MLVRGNNSTDSLVLSVILVTIAIVLISPIVSRMLYGWAAAYFGWKQLYSASPDAPFITELPAWWIGLSVLLLIAIFFVIFRGSGFLPTAN